MWFPGGRAASMQQRRSDDGRQRRNTWSGLDNKNKEVVGVKEKARRKKYKVRFSIIKKNMKVGVKKWLRAGMTPARTWGAHAVGMSPTERLKLVRQMAAAAGKKSTTSLSLFMEAHGLGVEDELSTMAIQYWAEGAWTGTWSNELKEAWMRQIREVRTWKQVRGPAGAVI